MLSKPVATTKPMTTGEIKRLDEDYAKVWPFCMAKALQVDAAEIYPPGIEQALDTLTEREHKVILRRFRDRLTLEQTGREFGITRERIRQIEAKAIRKLRHPSRAAMYKAVPYAELKACWADYYKLEAEYKQVAEAYRVLSDRPAEEVVRESDVLNKALDEMDLSVRSYNCLRRAGKDTIGKIADMSMYELSQVRNLGQKSLKEVVSRLRGYGVELRA